VALDPITQRSDRNGDGASASQQPGTPPQQVTIKFLQDQHRAVLGALAGELDKLKVENRDLKFRLVMRDTATPKAKTRAPSNATAAADVVAMRKELVELRQKNAAMEQERSEARAAAAAGVAGSQGVENNGLELNRVNKLNFDLLSEVAALRHELNVQSGRGDRAGSWRRTASGSSGGGLSQTHEGSAAHSSRSRSRSNSNSGGGGGGGGNADRLSQSLPPMGLASSASNGVGGSASRQPGLKDYGILKTGSNNQPRLLNRRRASGDLNGRTRRKLVPVAQPATLKPLNVGETLGAGSGFSVSNSTGSSNAGRGK